MDASGEKPYPDNFRRAELQADNSRLLGMRRIKHGFTLGAIVGVALGVIALTATVQRNDMAISLPGQ